MGSAGATLLERTRLERLVAAVAAVDGRCREPLPLVLAEEALGLVTADRGAVLVPGLRGSLELAAGAGTGLPEPGTTVVAGGVRAAPGGVLLLGGPEGLESALGAPVALPASTASLVAGMPLFGTGGALLVLQRVAGEAFGPEEAQEVQVLVTVAGRAAEAVAARGRLWSSLEKLDRAGESLLGLQHRKTVGELVAGLAHELNNPLTALAGYAQLLASLPPERLAENRAYLERIQEQATRCSSVLNRFAEFAASGSQPGEGGALARLVRDVLGLEAYGVRKARVSVEVDVPERLPVPAIEPGKLQQVLLHLVRNALAAMEGRELRRLEIKGRQEGGRCVLRVTDTGTGIDRQDLGRIFEPFYTTRPDEDAVGMGLPACVELLDACGGAITVASKPGEGSSFAVWIPLTPGPARPRGPARP